MTETDESKAASSAGMPDADKLLAESRGEFVEGISDQNDQKWVKGIQRRDADDQNQSEAGQNGQNTRQNEPEAQHTEPEAARENGCDGCGKSGGGHCPDCGAVMGDNTYSAVYGEEGEITGDVTDHGVMNDQRKVTADEVREIMKAVKPVVHADVEESTEEVNGELPPQYTDDNDDRSSSEASEDATTHAFDDSEVFLNEGYIREGEETDVEVRKLLEIMRQQQVMLEEIRSTQARFTGAVIAMLSAISGGEQVSHE